jgi:DNA-binding MltR family transcriptional regulator
MRNCKVGDKSNATDSLIAFLSSTKFTNVAVDELTARVFGTEEGAVCRMVKTCPLIDFAGPGLNVFQVSIGDKHECALIVFPKLKFNINYKSYLECTSLKRGRNTANTVQKLRRHFFGSK